VGDGCAIDANGVNRVENRGCRRSKAVASPACKQAEECEQLPKIGFSGQSD
jgi:hypothetical protein